MKTLKDPAGGRFTNINDVNLRLRDTIVLTEKGPLLVIEGYSKSGVVGFPWNHKENNFSTGVIKKTIPKIDYKNFQLGWFVSRGIPYYMTRIPVRRYKQGLSHENCMYNRLNGDSGHPRTGMIAECLTQKYSTLNDINKDIGVEKTKFYAMSPEVLVEKNPKEMVIYIGLERIGVFDREIKLDIDGLYSVYHNEPM